MPRATTVPSPFPRRPWQGVQVMLKRWRPRSSSAASTLSGTWVLGRPPSSEPGLLFYILVDSVAAALEDVVAHGGRLVQPIGMDAPEVTARFRDPGGNVVGLYQEPHRLLWREAPLTQHA